jgi:hypothetical protein
MLNIYFFTKGGKGKIKKVKSLVKMLNMLTLPARFKNQSK